MEETIKQENDDIRLVEVGADNFDDLIGLRPFESQYRFVADNMYSLAEAYANISDGRYAKPFGIYRGDEPVGFPMIGYDICDEEADREKFPLLVNNYLIWRFMIDKKHQNKGYETKAMKLALDFIRTFPCGEAGYCWLSYVPDNEVARRLYRSFGFVEAPEMPEGWDEIPAVLKL